MQRPNRASDEPRALLRRSACLFLGTSLLVASLTACGLKPKEYGPGEKPFWKIERQED